MKIYQNMLLISFLLTKFLYAQDTLKIDTSEYIAGENDYNLIMATFNQDKSEVIRFLEKGANPNTIEYYSTTPLVNATIDGNLEIIDILLDYGADINGKDWNGFPPLIHAVILDSLKIAEYLIRNGANINLASNDSITPLLWAISDSSYLMADMLLYYDADVNKTDNDGLSPLMLACYLKQKDLVKLLLSDGANPNLQDKDGKTALHYAIENGSYTITELLIKNNTNPNIKTHNGYSPLSIAVINNDIRTVQLLLENGANAKEKISLTANNLNIAIENKNDTIITLLLKYGAKRNLLPRFYRYNFGIHTNFNLHDFFTGIDAGITESKYDFNIFGQYAFRPFATRILEKVNDSLYYQLWERRGYFTLGMNKYFTVLSFGLNSLIKVNIGIKEMFTIGSYRGMVQKPKSRFITIPKLGIMLEDNTAAIGINYEYVKFDFPERSNGQINIFIHFYFYYNKRYIQSGKLKWLY